MAIAVNSNISSSAMLSGCNLPLHCQSCHTEDFGRCQLAGWRRVAYEGHKTTLGGSKETTGPSAIRFDSRNLSFGSSDGSILKTKKLRRMKVQVAADYSDSKSGAFECQGEPGYHPLEEVIEFEKPGEEDLRLTDAEIARTTVEANHSAVVLFSGMVHREPHKDIFRTELQYIVDDYGDIYIELNNNENILRSPRASNPVNVFIGLDDIQIYGEQKRTVDEEQNKINTEDISDTDNTDDYEEERNFISAGDDSSISGSLRDWEKLNPMNTVNPIKFSKKIAKVVSTNYLEKMDRPSNGLAIIGLLRPAFVEEESYLRKFLYGSDYSSGDDNYTEEDELSSGFGEPSSHFDAVTDLRPAENTSFVELENISDSRDFDVTNRGLNDDDLLTESSIPEDNDPDLVSMMLPEDCLSWDLGSEESDMNSSIYKLEILSIQLVSVYGNESIVSLQDFQRAEPDILVYSATEIINRVDNGGGKTECALRSLCSKKKGLHVEEAFLIGLDSLGVDIRVHCGAEVQTIRIAFNSRANSEEAAERQLRRLLFPRLRHKHRKSRRGRYRDS